MSSEINELIHKNASLAFRSGYECGRSSERAEILQVLIREYRGIPNIENIIKISGFFYEF